MSKTESLYSKGGYEVHEIENLKSGSMHIRYYTSNPRHQGEWTLQKTFRFKKGNDDVSRESALQQAMDWTNDANRLW